jgi:hypothetical protein
LWKEESKLDLQQLSEITLIKTYREFDETRVEHFLQFCKSQQNFKMQLLPPYNKSIIINSEFLDFSVANASLIKSLHLELRVNESQEFKLKFLNVLANLSHLKELVLDVYILESCWKVLDVGEVFQEMPQLPLVTKFETSWNFGNELEESDEPKVKNLCQKLLFMTPNLQELTQAVCNCMNEKFASVYFGEIVQLQEEWKESKSKASKPFQKLAFIKRLTLDHTSNNSEKILKSCLKFLQPLKGFEITIFCDGSDQRESTLQMILQKNSTTLETLDIVCYYNEDEYYNNNIINLPGLPKLKRLSLNRCAFNLRELLMVIQNTNHSCAEVCKI